MSPYKHCLLCPRRCGVDREAGFRGYCGETAALRLAFAGIHRGEEPPVTGRGGSGTVFVSGCNLGCAFCQNYQISQGDISHEGCVSNEGNIPQGIGRPVSGDEFAEICLALQNKGAENINIVTGSHAAPALALGVRQARKQGLTIPALWNSSGYDGAEVLEILKESVDVYLPDLKTLDPVFAARFFNAPDYPKAASLAILKMMEYRKLRLEETMLSGVMIRHLIVPGYLENTRDVLRWFAENCKGRALLSLMTQYTPVAACGGKKTRRVESGGAGIPSRYVSREEYDSVLSMLDEFEIDDGFCQELVTGSDWLPDFTRPNPFSSELSVPVWHWR
jgi:putative pyruvate formate lyase activating enzyme